MPALLVVAAGRSLIRRASTPGKGSARRHTPWDCSNSLAWSGYGPRRRFGQAVCTPYARRCPQEAVHQVHPGLSSQRRRGNAVPGAARDAVFAVLRELFPEHRFEQREVRVEVARPLQTDAEFRFPRLEASICGRGSPLSQCCDTTVLTFFDVVCGVCVICLKSTCASGHCSAHALLSAMLQCLFWNGLCLGL